LSKITLPLDNYLNNNYIGNSEIVKSFFARLVGDDAVLTFALNHWFDRNNIFLRTGFE